MSVVYLAQQTRPSRHVAVKILLPHAPVGSSLHNEFLARFQYEADIIAKLEHINIIPIFECDEQEGLAYLVMPYLMGGSLREVLAQRGPLSLLETMTYIEQAAQALDYAHAQGVIHRDLKPGNFLLHADGRLVLADFGIARIVQGNSNSMYSPLTNTGILLGTPDYMAPEMASGGQIDSRTDIYELGIVLFQMLAGDVPFKGRTFVEVIEKHLRQSPPLLHQFNPQIPPAVDNVIRKATAKKPGERYQSAGEFANALRNAITTPYYPTVAIPYDVPFVLSSLSTAASEASQPTEYSDRQVNEHPTPQHSHSNTKTSHNLPKRSRFWLVPIGMALVIAFSIIGLFLVNAHAPNDTAPNPQIEAKAVVNDFYGDINNSHYQAAYNLWATALQKKKDYCSFTDDYAHTLHDDISIVSITQNADGTLKVKTSIQASEKLNLRTATTIYWETATTTYQEYETVGQENGTWKILGASQIKTNRVATPEPPPATLSDAPPAQQAQALIQQFHNDISNRNYSAAYNSWGTGFQNSTDYCNFVGGYTNTLHHDVLFQAVNMLPDGTVQVMSTIYSTEETPSGKITTSSQETYIVGQENNAWKILSETPS